MLVNFLMYSQNPTNPVSPSYKYVSNPGFVNITEINVVSGLEDTVALYSKYY